MFKCQICGETENEGATESRAHGICWSCYADGDGWGDEDEDEGEGE